MPHWTGNSGNLCYITLRSTLCLPVVMEYHFLTLRSVLSSRSTVYLSTWLSIRTKYPGTDSPCHYCAFQPVMSSKREIREQPIELNLLTSSQSKAIERNMTDNGRSTSRSVVLEYGHCQESVTSQSQCGKSRSQDQTNQYRSAARGYYCCLPENLERAFSCWYLAWPA